MRHVKLDVTPVLSTIRIIHNQFAVKLYKDILYLLHSPLPGALRVQLMPQMVIQWQLVQPIAKQIQIVNRVLHPVFAKVAQIDIISIQQLKSV
jgi:hypothetical protein